MSCSPHGVGKGLQSGKAKPPMPTAGQGSRGVSNAEGPVRGGVAGKGGTRRARI